MVFEWLSRKATGACSSTALFRTSSLSSNAYNRRSCLPRLLCPPYPPMASPPDQRKLPADPAYAWVMIPVAMLMQAGTSPGQSFGVSLFMGPIREELGLSESALTGSYMIASALAAIPLMAIGKLMDRWGLRAVSMVLVLAVGGACFAISQVQGIIGLTCAFFALRAFGQGALSMAASNTLGTWFSRRLGLASGITGVGMSAIVAVVPLGVLVLIQNFGWRSAYATVGLIVVASLVPVLLLVYRNNVQVTSGNSSTGMPAVGDEVAFTLSQATRTPAYWVATASAALTGTVATGMFINLSKLFSEHGFTANQAAVVFPVLATAMGIMQIKGGLLADRVPLRYLLGASMALLGVAAWCLGCPSTLGMAYVGAAALGANQGLMSVTGNTLWPRYFGRRHLGSIRSSVWTAMVVGCSVGPFIMGSTFDLLGSYVLSIVLFVSLSAIVALAAIRYGAPPQQVEPHDSSDSDDSLPQPLKPGDEAPHQESTALAG